MYQQRSLEFFGSKGLTQGSRIDRTRCCHGPGRNKEWYVLDPDVGVVIPQSLTRIENDVSEARRRYEIAFSRTGLPAEEIRWNVDLITGFYSSASDNSIDTSGRLGYYSSLASPPEWYGEREQLAYKLKWPLPFLFLIIGFLIVLVPRRRSPGRANRRSTNFTDLVGQDP